MSVLAGSVETMLDVLWRVAATGLIHGTAVAVITALLAATVLKRARPALMAALWTIVLVKFLVPLGPEVPVSISGLVDAVLAPTQAAGQVAASAAASPGHENAASPSAGALAWLAVQSLLWLAYAGVVIRLLVRRIRSQQALRRQAEALAPADGAVLAMAAQVGHCLGLARLPAVRTAEAVASPYVVGLWRPILVVPAWLSGAPLRAALLHELAHLRRRDTWLRCVQLLAGTLFWFWPVVRWVNRRIDMHREMACDQWAISYGPLRAAAYARMLLDFARRAARPAADAGEDDADAAIWGTAMGLLGGRTELESRVHALLRGRARPRLGLVSGALVAAWALVSLGGGARGAHAEVVAGECVISPELVAQLLSQYPEADADGNGVLTREEVCAYEKRMQRLIGDRIPGSAEGSVDTETGLGRPEPVAAATAGAAVQALGPADLEAYRELWSSAGLSDCEACNCTDTSEKSAGSSSALLEKTICSNEVEQ